MITSINAQNFNTEVKNIDKVCLNALYNMSYANDTNNVKNLNSEDMLLQIGENATCFQSYKLFRFNQIVRKKQREGNLNQWIMSGGSIEYTSIYVYKIYKYRSDNKIVTRDATLMSGGFQYEENIDTFNWTINGDTATINGYFSQKATCEFGGRKWQAWFTTEIPYSDGPYKFCGLPGLIIKISDTKGHYCFTLKSLNKPSKDEYVELEDSNYIMTTKKEFFKVQDNDTETSASFFNSVNKSAQGQAKMNSTIKSLYSNPIELDRK